MNEEALRNLQARLDLVSQALIALIAIHSRQEEPNVRSTVLKEMEDFVDRVEKGEGRRDPVLREHLDILDKALKRRHFPS